IAHRALQYLAHDRGAIALAQHVERHLAWTEARQFHLLSDLAQPPFYPLLDIVGVDGDLEFVLQAVGAGFGDLHDARSLLKRLGWCGRRDLNPQAFRRSDLNRLRLPVPPRPPAAERGS